MQPPLLVLPEEVSPEEVQPRRSPVSLSLSARATCPESYQTSFACVRERESKPSSLNQARLPPKRLGAIEIEVGTIVPSDDADVHSPLHAVWFMHNTYYALRLHVE